MPSAPDKYVLAGVGEFFEQMGIENVVASDYLTLDKEAVFESDDSYAGYLEFYIEGSSDDEFDIFAKSMVKAGWKVLAAEAGVYQLAFSNTDARAYLANYGYYYGFAFYDGFPTSTFVADMTALGIPATDLPPRLTGSARSYNYNKNAHQLVAVVEEGKEAATVAQYQADLVAAGFTEAGDDGVYGMHYASPNNKLDVVVWDAAALIGYTGYVVVNFKKIVTGVSSATELMQQIAIYAWGYTEDGDFEDPDENGIVKSNYTIGGSNYSSVALADSEECLNSVLTNFISGSGFPAYLNVVSGPTYVANAIGGSIGISQIYLMTSDSQFVLYMYCYYYNSKVSIVFQAGPIAAYSA